MNLHRTEVRASAAGDLWGTVGDGMNRHSRPVADGRRARRKCPWCDNRATHLGMSNGVALIQACQLHTARWVRTGDAHPTHGDDAA